MPVRFTSPSLGGQRESFLNAGEWQLGLAYRHLGADQWFVGADVNEAAAPHGHPLFLDINSLDFSVVYGITNRTSLTLTLPFSYGTHSRVYDDLARHKVSAFGLGDVSLVGSAWLLDPSLHDQGNVSLALGIKSPTGNNGVEDDFFSANGSVDQRPVDQSIQLGDGGWGILLQVQAFQHVFTRGNAYLFGSYLVSPRKVSDVPSPLPGVPLSVPDVYTARAGLAYALVPDRGISISLGGRLDGLPLRDLIGGGDLGFRRPGFIFYLDPGASFRLGGDELTLGLPIRIRQDFRASLFDRERRSNGGGDLADVLMFAGYTHRF
jgi:hypothetical protein